MNQILKLLSGGDRRSIGRSDEVVELILQQPDKFDDLFRGFYETDPVIRMRTADAVEKVTAQDPALLIPYKEPMLELLESAEQIEVQWHLAQIIPRLPLTNDEISRAYQTMEKYLSSSSAIVQTCGLQCLFDLSLRDARLLASTRSYLESGMENQSKAVRSRSRNLMKELEKHEKR
ncbi:MAG TPA: hypothetical protein PLL88_02540 [Anaerolineaceae bacterium]|nr:hypothetical protein [Anaerolineaceae bacterium]